VKRFRFGLEKALELRQYREQEAKNELGRAIGILTEIENNIKLNASKHAHAAQERFVGIAASGGGGGLSVQAWDNYILRLEQEAERLMEEAAQAEIVVEEKRNLYIEASRELKVMEKLKEKQKNEHRKESLAAAALEADDAHRKRSSSL
jgi:flagellar FliJ protein